MATRFPLSWPLGWPRTAPRQRANGKNRWSHDKKPWTFDAARKALSDELEALGAQDVILSTNYDLRLDGQPKAGSRTPDDVGIAVYFKREGRPVVMARDAFDRAEENMRSLSLALRAMRAIEEHGGSLMMEKAFEGFTALPPPTRWWETLGVPEGATVEEIKLAHRARAPNAHPDSAHGSHARMAELNAARDEGLKVRKLEAAG